MGEWPKQEASSIQQPQGVWGVMEGVKLSWIMSAVDLGFTTNSCINKHCGDLGEAGGGDGRRVACSNLPSLNVIRLMTPALGS